MENGCKSSNGFPGQGRVQVQKKKKEFTAQCNLLFCTRSLLRWECFEWFFVCFSLRQIIRLRYQNEWVFDNRQLNGGAGGLYDGLKVDIIHSYCANRY